MKRYSYLVRKPLTHLLRQADQLRARHQGNRLEFCSIVNAKSGRCAQNCTFCAQSSRHTARIEAYPLLSQKKIVAAARRAKEIGAQRFGIVTSGNSLSEEELKRLADSVAAIVSKVGITACASLGKLAEAQLRLLKKAGLSRYHHNIETSPRYFKHICTTHTFEDRLATIAAAQNAGLEVCSGGIIGLGESWRDRIAMALVLKKLRVDSVPINILVPIKGTPLAKQPLLSCVDAIRAIALFRIILKDKTIRLAAGRESVLQDFQTMAFVSGANAMMIGGYLTVRGRDPRQDHVLARQIKKLWKE